jgi:hypothetical protein
LNIYLAPFADSSGTYAGNNPVNATDPSGQKESFTCKNTLLAVPIDSQFNGCGGVWVDSYLAGYINHEAGTITRMTNGGNISGAVLLFGVSSGTIIRYLWNNVYAPGSIGHSHCSRWATMPESGGACTANGLANFYLNASGFAINAQLGLLPLYEQYVGAFQVFAGNDRVDHHAGVEGTLAYWMDRVANGNLTNYEQAVSLAQSKYLASFCMGFEGDINGCDIGENVTQHIANLTSYNQPTEGTNYPTVCPESESRWIV